MSYLPISWAISWTRWEKGCLHMRSSVLFWNQWILWRASIPSWYFWGLFNIPAFRNYFCRPLPSTVGQTFLWAGSSPGDVNGSTSVAIWVNCWVGDDPGDLPTSSDFLTSILLLSTSPGVKGLCSCMYLHSCLYLCCCRCLLSCLFLQLHCLCLGLCPGFNLPALHPPPSVGHLSACHTGTAKSTNKKLRPPHGGHVAFVNLLLCIFQKLCRRSIYFSLLFLPCLRSGIHLHGS